MKNTVYKNIKYKQGQAMLTMVILFLFISMTIVFGAAVPVLKQVKIAKENYLSKQSYFLAKAGMEDVIYRIETNKQLSSPEVLSLDGQTVSTNVTNTSTGKQITSTGDVGGDIRKIQTNIILGTGVTFHYGIQSGAGGFVLKNSSTVTGNVFSGGPVVGSGNYIYGDVISSGPTGLIDNIHVTGSAYAHTINDSVVDKNAYYVSKSGTTVTGTSYPGSTDQGSSPLPISDDQITEWENDAVAGGIIIDTCDGSGNYSITSNTTIGPAKIDCNLIIKGSGIVVTVAGPIWVVGDITTQTGPTIKMASGLGNLNVPIIADNPSNKTGSGIITIGQSTSFQGSGATGSFVFLISQNNSSEMGGTTDAISMNQGAAAMVTYASHGQVTLSQSVSLKEVTAYKIVLTQTANVVYDTGLPSVLFSSGPSGGYEITDWTEVE